MCVGVGPAKKDKLEKLDMCGGWKPVKKGEKSENKKEKGK